MESEQTGEAGVNELSLLTDVFEQAPAFMAVLAGPEHVFELVNPAYYQLVGHRDVLGKPVLAALPEVVGQGYIELLDAVLRTGEPFVGKEMKLTLQVTPAGPYVDRYVDFVYQPRRNAQGAIVGVFAHGVDVTDLTLARQRSEDQALQIKRYVQTFESVLAHISDFIYTFDREGRFTYANQPLLNLLGLSLAQIVGKTFFELPYPEALATTLHTYILEVVANKQTIVDETPYTSPTGQQGYYEYVFSPVLGDDGEVEFVAGSTRDITARVLEQRQKDEFLGIVSHELKTPVTSIKAYVQALQKRLAKAGAADAAEHLHRVDVQLNKLTLLISDLLDVTKINSGRLQFREADFAFDEVVAEAVEAAQRTTERQRILVEGKTNAIMYGDRDRIGQVLSNLLSNAVKYAPQADTIAIRSSADDAAVTVCVQDFGPGLSAEQLPHVFEQFFRASEGPKAAIPGLGLGLYIASEFVRRHHGTIWAESAPGQGATFCFSLPVAGRRLAEGQHNTTGARGEGA